MRDYLLGLETPLEAPMTLWVGNGDATALEITHSGEYLIKSGDKNAEDIGKFWMQECPVDLKQSLRRN